MSNPWPLVNLPVYRHWGIVAAAAAAAAATTATTAATTTASTATFLIRLRVKLPTSSTRLILRYYLQNLISFLLPYSFSVIS
jgi:hypothetical protein